MMKTKAKLFTVLFPILIGCTVSSIAVASVTFSDGTFNLSDYSITKYQTGGADFNISQSADGGNPGQGLQIEVNIPTNYEFLFYTSASIMNKTFSYDPGTQGTISSIDASADGHGQVTRGGVPVPLSPLGGSGSGGGVILLEQNGHFYTNLVGVIGPPSVGSNDYHTSHANGLKEADFGLITDLATFELDKTQHPNFSSGVIEFGVPYFLYFTSLGFMPETNAFSVSDNLSFTISTVPEPETYAMLLAGLGLLGWRLRRA